MYVGPAMPAAETPDKKLDQIVVYSDDKREMDRLFGDSVSYAKRQKAILAVVKRERLVEKIRRQVLGSLEAYLCRRHAGRRRDPRYRGEGCLTRHAAVHLAMQNLFRRDLL